MAISMDVSPEKIAQLHERLNQLIDLAIKADRLQEALQGSNQLLVHAARRVLGELSALDREGGPTYPLTDSGDEYTDEQDFFDALLYAAYGDDDIVITDAEGKRWQPLIDVRWVSA